MAGERSPNDGAFLTAISTLLTEVFEGPPGDEAYILNPGDPGLLRQIDTIEAAAASSRTVPGKTTIAAHVDHVNYGLTLLNRWAAGEENPWASADWNASWQRSRVTDQQWQALRDQFRKEARAWREAVVAPRQWNPVAAAGVIASVAHTAYHLGAIRQILAAQGPRRP